MVVLKDKQDFKVGHLLVPLNDIKTVYSKLMLNTLIEVNYIFEMFDGISFRIQGQPYDDEVRDANLKESFRKAYKNEKKLWKESQWLLKLIQKH